MLKPVTLNECTQFIQTFKNLGNKSYLVPKNTTYTLLPSKSSFKTQEIGLVSQHCIEFLQQEARASLEHRMNLINDLDEALQTYSKRVEKSIKERWWYAICQCFGYSFKCPEIIRRARVESGSALFEMKTQKQEEEKRIVNAEKAKKHRAWAYEEKFLSQVLELDQKGRKRIFSMSYDEQEQILNRAKKHGKTIDLHEVDPASKMTLFGKAVYQGTFSLIQAMIEMDPTVCKQKNSNNKLFFTVALQINRPEIAALLHETMRINHYTIDKSADCLWKAYSNSDAIQDKEFKNLIPSLKEDIFRIANLYLNYRFIDRLNTLGMGAYFVVEGPAILAADMDAASVYYTLRNFLLGLRNKQLLLTKQEFEEQFPDKTRLTLKNREFDELIGKKFIEDKIRELKLQFISAPPRIAVLDEDQNSLSFAINSKTLNITSTQFTIYEENIEEVERPLRREEIKELIRFLEETHYKTNRIIIGKDKIYIRDCKIEDFGDTPLYAEMFCFSKLLDEPDQDWLTRFLTQKISHFELKRENFNKDLQDKKKFKEKQIWDYGFKYRNQPITIETSMIFNSLKTVH